MSVRRIKAGTTDVSVIIRIVDSTDRTPETGVVFNTSGIDLWYRREGAASVDITEATLSALTDAHADGGFLHINDGWYRLDLPDAACATGVSGVQIGGTVTGMVVLAPYVELPVNTEEDVYTRIGAPAGASVSADIAAIEAQTDDIGAAGAGLTAADDAILAILGSPAGASMSADIAAVKAQTAAIETDTQDLQTKIGTPAGASLAADVAAIEAQTDDIGAAGAGLTAVPWNAAWDAEVQSEVADALDAAVPATPTANSINERIKTMDDADLPGDVAAVKADTAAILEDTGTTLPATLATIAGYIDTEVAAIKVDTAAILADTGTDGVVVAAASKSGYSLAADQSGVTVGTVNALGTQAKADVNAEVDTALDDAVADSVPADGSRPSVRQALYILTQFMLERSVSGTTVTVKKPDGSTSLLTLTLDDATSPTSVTRAS